MGFRVEINPAAKPFIERLCAAPSSIFREPYAGYLLFLFDLVSDSDAAVSSWFCNHAESLDAMTGKDVAFAVMSYRTHVKIRVPHGGENRPPTIREAPVGVTDPGVEISKLIRSGRFGRVADGDEIRAVNSAVYDIARTLGITRMLPCMVALDGVPDSETPFLTFPLGDCDLGELFGVIRRAVGRLQSVPGLQPYQRGLRTILDVTMERENLQRQLAKAEAKHFDKTVHLLRRDNLGVVSHWLTQLEVALRRGNERLLRRSVRFLGHYHPDEGFAEDFVAKFWPASAGLSEALAELGRALTSEWPLAQLQKERITRLVDGIRDLLPDGTDTPSTLGTRQGAASLHGRIAQIRVLFVGRAMQELPSADQWAEWRRMRLEELPHSTMRLTGPSDTGTDERRPFRVRYDRPLAEADLKIFRLSRELLAMPERPMWSRLLHQELSGAPDRTPPTSHDPGERIMDWVPLTESLSLLRARDLFGLSTLWKQVALHFGGAIRKRGPTAFASYATSDRDEVLRRVQGMRAFQPGLDIFLDFYSLRPGDRWKERLREEIGGRDRFFLFWSRAASASTYVTEEWRTALERRKPITPVPLCCPDEAPPPQELEHLHFGDYYAEFLKLGEIRATPST